MTLGSTLTSDTQWNSVRLGAHSSSETYTGSRFGSIASTAAYPPTPLPHEGQINNAIDINSSTVPYVSVSGNYTTYDAKIKRAIVYGGAPALVPQHFSSRGWYYADIAAIYNNSYPGFSTYVPGSTNQGSFILTDVSSNRLFLPYGSSVNGQFAQYAADAGNTSWRSFYLANNVQNGINAGYMGTRMDDVNPAASQTYTSNGTGTHVDPLDPRTGTTMTVADYNKYIAQQVEGVHSALPNHELLCNMQWFAGNNGSIRGYNNPYIQRIIAASSVMEIERGIIDNFAADNGTYSYQALYEYVDYVHSVGKGVFWKMLDSVTSHTQLEYQLATYLLLSNGNDYVSGCMVSANPATYWTAYDIDLGNASAARYAWNGLIRRDFDSGFVLVDPPGGPTVTNLALGGTFTNTSGAGVTTVSLTASNGAVFRN